MAKARNPLVRRNNCSEVIIDMIGTRKARGIELFDVDNPGGSVDPASVERLGFRIPRGHLSVGLEVIVKGNEAGLVVRLRESTKRKGKKKAAPKRRR